MTDTILGIALTVRDALGLAAKSKGLLKSTVTLQVPDAPKGTAITIWEEDVISQLKDVRKQT